MRRARACLVILAWLAQAAAGADLAHEIRELLDASPAARTAFWGIQIVDQANGKTLFALNENHFFVPASNAKLFTTALALVRLGPAYRFETTVWLDQSGSIRLVGGGDPNLSNRAIPYRKGPAVGNPLQAIEDLADQVVARGVREIRGDVIGDDSAYVWEPFPDGWAIDDPLWDYGAPVSALTINDNSFTLAVRPGRREGDPASIQLTPALEFYQIDNRARTDSSLEKKIHIARDPGSMQLRVWGTIPAADKGETQELGIDDPAQYAARAFQDALTRRGVNVSGQPVAHHLFPNQAGSPPAPLEGERIAVRSSAPLVEDLRITDKVSQNLHAEMLLRAVARARRGIGSRQAGLEELKAFLAEAGIEQYHFADGSGLSRLDLVTPASVVKLLEYMHDREHWVSLLPIGGQDGTLSARLAGTAAEGRIHAKTGSLSHVAALSGYAEREDGATRTFAILVNNFNGRGSEIRAVIDKICSLMVE